MKKALTLLLLAGCMISLASCNEKKEIADNTTKAEVSSEEVKNEITTESISENSEEKAIQYDENDFAVWNSPLGYSMEYNTKLFEGKNTDNTDFFSCNIGEELKAPTYVSVQKYLSSDIKTVADEVAVKLGLDKDSIQDTSFGSDLIDAKSLYTENEMNGIKIIQVVYIVADGEDSIVIESTSYVSAPEEIDWCYERMLNSFKLK